MTEQLISFETAELAKEKGFEFIWEDYESESLELGRFRWCSFYKDPNKIEALPINWLDTNHSAEQWGELGIDCPTQSLLQRWLREEHDIYVHCRHDLNPNFTGILYYTNWGFIKSTDKNKAYSHHGGYDEFNEWTKYEDALEFGLKEALKLIK